MYIIDLKIQNAVPKLSGFCDQQMTAADGISLSVYIGCIAIDNRQLNLIILGKAVFCNVAVLMGIRKKPAVKETRIYNFEIQITHPNLHPFAILVRFLKK